ncbi:MAG: hypothetical protein ACR2MO_11590 [Acidimicrobiales bacterium]
MEGVAIDRLVTDALLLDAVEGLDSIASRLACLYDDLGRCRDQVGIAANLPGILADLGWWSGRLQGAVSAETASAVDGLASDEA